MQLKHFIAFLVISGILLSLSSCQDSNNGIVPTSEEIYWSKVENKFPNHSWVKSLYKNNIDGKQHLSLLRKDTNIVDIYISDDGDTWSLKETIIPANLNFEFGFAEEFSNEFDDILLGKNGVIFYKISSRLFRSLSNFENFEEIKSNLKYEDSQLDYKFFDDIMFDHDGTIYSGMTLKSTDNGNTWQELASGLQYVHKANTLFKDQSIFVLYDDGYYLSQDKGVSWANIKYPKVYEETGFITYFTPGDILNLNPTPLSIKEPKKGNMDLYYMTEDSTLISNICGNNTLGKKEWEYSFSFNIYTSSDFGKNWDFQFCVQDAWKINYVESGYFYITTPIGILRNKKPIK